MDALLLCVRVALAVVFLTSGLVKLRDRDATRAAAGGFGLPDRVGRAAGVMLPLFEISIGATLPLPWTARYAAVAACTLLVAFTWLVVRTVARGEDVSCNCFGATTTRVTWRTAVRNVVLLAMSCFAVAGPDQDGRLAAWRWLGAGIRPFAAVGAPLLVALVVGFGLRRRRRPRQRTNVLDLPLERLDGSPVTLASLLRPRLPVALLFLEPGCHQCVSLLPDIAEWRNRRSLLEIVILVPSGGAGAEAKFGALGVPVLVDRTLSVGLSLGVNKRPTGVLIRPPASAAPPAHGEHAIRRLIAPYTDAPARDRRWMPLRRLRDRKLFRTTGSARLS